MNHETAEGAPALREALQELTESARLLGEIQAKKEDGVYTPMDARAERAMYVSIEKWKRAALASVHPVPAPAAICGHGNGNPNNCPECRPERFPGEPSHWPALVRRLESLEAVLRADKLWAPVVRSEALNVVRQTIAARAHPVAPAPSADSEEKR